MATHKKRAKMLIIPKEDPDIGNLNTYYLDIEKLIEHCQGEFGSGAIHFRGPAEEGVIFFDKDDILDGVFRGRNSEFGGRPAIDHLMDAARGNSFVTNIYAIDPEKIYFWANMHGAVKIHKDLSTDFTDLEGLIKKMSSENLTGYIEASINNGTEGGFIFFNHGEIIGGSYSWGNGRLNGTKESQKRLIQKTKEAGGVFHVSKILRGGEGENRASEADGPDPSPGIISALEDLLAAFEKSVSSKKRVKTDFHTLLKRKFMEKADKYTFLDPFAGELEYVDHTIKFSGDAGDEDLLNGIMEAVEDLAGELGMLPNLADTLARWSRKHANEVARFGISF
ncbi:MAG: hypothetical protein R6V46_12605 [Desulfatiglandaceae bacterium]